MARQLNSKRRDVAKEREILSKPVNSSGEGEDPIVRAVLSEEFVNGSNAQAFDIAMGLQQLIRGQASLLENQKSMADEIAQMKQRMDEMDKAAQAWNNNQSAFLEDVMGRAEKLRLSGSKLDELRAREMTRYQQEVSKARVADASSRVEFASWLGSQPKETIISPGVLETVVIDGVPQPRISPEVLRIKKMTFVLPPGEPIEVPAPIAAAWRNRQQMKQGAQKVEQALALDNNISMGQRHTQEAIAQKLETIKRDYKMGGDAFPVR